MEYFNYDSVTVGISKRCQAALVLIPVLQERYSSFYNNELYLNMTWLDPQYWQEGPNNRKDKILQLINYFEVLVATADFDKTKVLKERPLFQVTCKWYYKDFTAKSLGKNVSIQEKGIPKFANTSRACYVFLSIEQGSWKNT